MAVIFDADGNPSRLLAAQGNDAVVDARGPATLAALNAEVVIDLLQETAVAIDVRGTFVANLIFEVSFDGSNWQAYPIFSTILEANFLNIIAPGQTQASIPPGAKRVRIRVSSYTSGAATVVFRAARAPISIYTKQVATTMQTVSAASGAAATLTIPATVGVFNYLAGLHIVKFNAAVLTASATPVLVTTTGLAGLPIFTFNADAAALGTSQEFRLPLLNPIRGTAVNTTMVISCPATTGVIWRVNASFFIGF